MKFTPPDANSIGFNMAREWMRYAWSDFQLAHIGRPRGVLRETLVFHAQQAAEKAFKAVLTIYDVDFPPTHNLALLRELLPDSVILPEDVADATALSVYAVAARYPQDTDDLDEASYLEAMRQAKAALDWAAEIIESGEG